MCCICFEQVAIDEVYVCEHGQKWDLCARDGKREGCIGCDCSCGYKSGSFACKIRHISINTGWAKSAND